MRAGDGRRDHRDRPGGHVTPAPRYDPRRNEAGMGMRLVVGRDQCHSAGLCCCFMA